MQRDNRFDYVPGVANMRQAILGDYRFEIYPREVDGFEYSEYVILQVQNKAENAWRVLVLDGMPTQDLAEQECRRIIGGLIDKDNREAMNAK